MEYGAASFILAKLHILCRPLKARKVWPIIGLVFMRQFWRNGHFWQRQLLLQKSPSFAIYSLTRKQGAPFPPACDGADVNENVIGMLRPVCFQEDNCLHKAFLSLGSNSDNAGAMLSRAIKSIASLPNIQILKESPVYLTEPQGYTGQPWFHNQAILTEAGADWTPIMLVNAMLDIERTLGRRRGPIRFGPRCIDIDLLLFDDKVSSDPACILPHPRLTERAFALLPLADIAPGVRIGGKTAQEWLKGLTWRLDGCKIFQ